MKIFLSTFLVFLISIGNSIAQISELGRNTDGVTDQAKKLQKESVSMGDNEKGAPAEYVLRNGLVYDGRGNPPKRLDVAIRNGKIETITPGQKMEAKETINVDGLIVAPGFIDVHNHSPLAFQMTGMGLNEAYIRQGVTTVVGGPDGYYSPSGLKNVIAALDTIVLGTNVGFYVGHNGIRMEVMGDGNNQQRVPTEKEMEQMKKLVEEGMQLGAVGFSTGLMYEPGMFSNTEEVIVLAETAAEYNGIYDSHVRNPVTDWLGSNTEVIEISRQAGLPAKMGHIKAVGLSNQGKTKELIEMVNSAKAEGLKIVTDQYPYDGAAGYLTLRGIVIPTNDISLNEKIHKDSVADLSPYLQDSQLREKAKELSEKGINGGFSWIKAVGYDGLRIVASKDYPGLVGKYLSEIAENRGQHPFDLVAELVLNSKHPISIKGGIAEEDVRAILVQPWNMIASDGLPVTEDYPNLGHPRSTGTFPRVLGYYVREERLLTMEEAIRKMTSFPADFVGFKNRGRIQNNMAADIAVFDAETIRDNSDYVNPNRYSSGVIHVFVNGIPVLLNEKMTGNGPGKYLRSQNTDY